MVKTSRWDLDHLCTMLFSSNNTPWRASYSGQISSYFFLILVIMPYRIFCSIHKQSSVENKFNYHHQCCSRGAHIDLMLHMCRINSRTGISALHLGTFCICLLGVVDMQPLQHCVGRPVLHILGHPVRYPLFGFCQTIYI